jgi:hypothetical protein
VPHFNFSESQSDPKPIFPRYLDLSLHPAYLLSHAFTLSYVEATYFCTNRTFFNPYRLDIDLRFPSSISAMEGTTSLTVAGESVPCTIATPLSALTKNTKTCPPSRNLPVLLSKMSLLAFLYGQCVRAKMPSSDSYFCHILLGICHWVFVLMQALEDSDGP